MKFLPLYAALSAIFVSTVAFEVDDALDEAYGARRYPLIDQSKENNEPHPSVVIQTVTLTFNKHQHYTKAEDGNNKYGEDQSDEGGESGAQRDGGDDDDASEKHENRHGGKEEKFDGNNVSALQMSSSIASLSGASASSSGSILGQSLSSSSSLAGVAAGPSGSTNTSLPAKISASNGVTDVTMLCITGTLIVTVATVFFFF